MTTKHQTDIGRFPAPASTLANLRAEVVALESLDTDLLRKRWRSVMRRLAPAHLSRSLLFRILAYRFQADALGDINKWGRSTLSRAPGAQCSSASALNTSRALVRPGTLLTREYGGVTHRVMVSEAGYSWNGRSFRSLSEVATAITGTKWNGPRFFGLKRLALGDQRQAEAGRSSNETSAANGGVDAARSSERGSARLARATRGGG
jgi:hypothetical protein